METKHLRFTACLGAALLAAALHLRTVAFGFVYDDDHLIVNNAFLREAWSPIRAFGHHFWYGTASGTGYYRPFVVMSLALGGRLFGWGPAGFHLVNVLLHAANAALLLVLSRRLGAPLWASSIAAAFFAVHPVAAWPVASIVARVDLLPAFFILLAWILLERSGPAEPPARAAGPLVGAAAAGALCLAALLCKESALAFLAVPLIGLLAARGPGRQGSPEGPRPPGRPKGAWAPVAFAGAALLVYLALRRAAGVGLLLPLERIDPLTNPIARLPFPGRLWSALALSGRYLLYLLVPVGFADPRDYSPRVAPPGPGDPWALLASLFLIAWVAAVVALARRRDRLAAPLAFCLVSFLPASNLLAPIAALYAQNFLYMPLVGLSLALGIGLGRSRPPPEPVRAAVPAIAFLPVALLAAGSFREAGIWRDAPSLFRAWTERFPSYAVGYGGLGAALLARGDPAGALAPLRRAIVLDDRSVEAHHNLGVALVLTARGRDRRALEEALAESRAALRLSPGLLPARANASRALLLLDRPAEAEAEAREALRLSPGYLPARQFLAASFQRQRRFAEAIALYRDLARLDPADAGPRSHYVVCLIEAGQLEEATRAAQAARREFPGSAYFDFCLARIAARSGRKDEAAALLRAALERDPSARRWIANVRDFEALRTAPELKTLLEPGR